MGIPRSFPALRTADYPLETAPKSLIMLFSAALVLPLLATPVQLPAQKLSAQAPGALAALQAGATRRPTSLVDLGGLSLQGSISPAAGSLTFGMGGISVSKGLFSQRGVRLTYYTLTINPGSGFAETFVVFVPTPFPLSPRPALVAFHGFGVSQMDIVVNTPLLQECAARKWILIAPLSASDGHFMCDPGQTNTQAVLDWALAGLPIDKTRIYAIGFSMGGGMALNYAARHLDPKRGMFAAMVDHTGAVDLNHVYASDPPAQFVFDFWYGDGTPGSADPVLMTRGSVIRYDSLAQQVDPHSDLVHNLDHAPLRIVRAANDPLAYLRTQCEILNAHLLSLGRLPGPTYVYEVKPGSSHSWGTLDAKAACNWLKQFNLVLPSSGMTLASSDAMYFHFFVDQDDPSEFTPFTWKIDPIANELSVRDSANLAMLAVDTGSAGLSTSQPLVVVMSTADDEPDRIVLNSYAVPPASVLRDGGAALSGWWSYNPAAKTLLLTETEGSGVHTWTVIP